MLLILNVSVSIQPIDAGIIINTMAMQATPCKIAFFFPEARAPKARPRRAQTVRKVPITESR